MFRSVYQPLREGEEAHPEGKEQWKPTQHVFGNPLFTVRMDAKPYIAIQYRLEITSQSMHHPRVWDMERQLGRANVVAVRER